jgi:hypothetical protein
LRPGVSNYVRDLLVNINFLHIKFQVSYLDIGQAVLFDSNGILCVVENASIIYLSDSQESTSTPMDNPKTKR